jgi:hypothetical protein
VPIFGDSQEESQVTQGKPVALNKFCVINFSHFLAHENTGEI